MNMDIVRKSGNTHKNKMVVFLHSGASQGKQIYFIKSPFPIKLREYLLTEFYRVLSLGKMLKLQFL